jgi:hypothetical protein
LVGSRRFSQGEVRKIAQSSVVASTVTADRRVVGALVGADHPEGDVLPAAALDRARGALADRVGVDEEGDHHLRVVSGGVAVRSVGGVEGLEVELVDRLDHEPREVIGGQPVAQVGWQQQRLVTVAREEVLSHARRPERRGQ